MTTTFHCVLPQAPQAGAGEQPQVPLFGKWRGVGQSPAFLFTYLMNVYCVLINLLDAEGLIVNKKDQVVCLGPGRKTQLFSTCSLPS